MKIKFALSLLLFFPFSGYADVQATQPPVAHLKKVVWIWLENTSDVGMMQRKYLQGLWAKMPSVRFTHYTPSHLSTQANAMTLISGSDFGISDNEITRVNAPILTELLDAQNISWKVYAEDFPGACYLSEGDGNYKRYRVPFLSIARIQSDRYQCMKIVGFSNLTADIKYSSLPDFSIIIPNLQSSGALTDEATADFTLQELIPALTSDPNWSDSTTLIVSTLNQDVQSDLNVFTLILGNGVAAAHLNIDTPYSHANLLRTIEDGLNLGSLNQGDALASPLLGFWK